ncbi:MAG: trehalose-phosphatase [Gammaproteobacteria bacterium]
MDASQSPQPPLPAPGDRWALFLDFDGTLVPIAARPSAVRWRPLLGAQLRRLERALDGALAVVSGRSIEDLGRIIAPTSVMLAGLHGLEQIDAQGNHVRSAPAEPLPANIGDRLRALTGPRPGLELEEKGPSVAVHYRHAPHLAGQVRSELDRIVGELGPHWMLQTGKMVVELRPAGRDKGTVIGEFLEGAPFHGRTPVYVGDDDTDEAAFAVVNARGGISVKVGSGATCARWRLRSVSQVWWWLKAITQRLE